VIFRNISRSAGNLDFLLEKFFPSGFLKFPADFSDFLLENLFSG
jgi:hypothetical protein